MVADFHSIMARWRNYFSQLLNVHGVNDVRQAEIHTTEPLVPEPSAFGFELAIEKLKSRKSPGVDQIPTGLIKAGGKTLRCAIHKFIISVWNKEELPVFNEELSDLYSLPNIVRVVKSRRIRWAEHVARMVEGRGVYRVLVGKPEGKRPLGRPRRRWEDNIKMDLQAVGGVCGAWLELAEDRDRWRALVSTVMNFRVP